MADGGSNTELGNEPLPKLAVEGDADQDTCRICSAPAEPDQPLFHPCKCSGTIRYIHQDCLTTWLSHSKKKTCDVCKHPYSFTKVYADDMPRQLPTILLLRKLAQQAVFAVFFCIRAIIVSFVWLAILPWVTVWTWRVYFAVGNHTAWWISARPGSSSSSSSSPSSFFFYNLTSRSQSNSTATNSTLRHPSNDTHSSTLDGLLAHPLLRSISADIFAGQIIATLIVLVFIAVFLLREWISQNARPGVFEEGDHALAAEPEAEQERERQQRVREQARAIIEQRNIQLRRRQQAEAERPPRARDGDPHQLGSTRHHPDQPIGDLPTRPPSRRAHELRATYKTTHPDQVELSSSDTAGPSSAMSPTVGGDPNPSYVQARQEWLRAAEKRRLFPLGSTSSSEEQRGSSSPDSNAGSSAQAKSVDNAVLGSRKGKAKAVDIEESNNQDPASISVVSDAENVLAALKQKRITWGIPGAESWALYDFERFEMTRLGLDLMFSPHGVVAETDPWQLIIQAGIYPVVQDGTTLFTSAGVGTHTIAAPDDWTEWLGDAVDDAWRWRARRRVLWERLREEAERDGLGTLQLPSELSGIPIEELRMVQDINCVWTPPPAPKLNSRLPVLAGLSQTPSQPGATDDQASLLTAHKQLRAEGSRVGRSFTISTVSIASPDEDDGRSRHMRPRTHSQADSKAFAFPPLGGGDQLFPNVTQKPLPFPISPTVSLSHEPPSQFTVSTHSHSSSLPSSPTFHPLDSQPPPAPAISMPRRPPMPNTTIPTPTSATPSLLPRSSRDSTPLESPSLATYQPPEEFQEGSSRQGYFDNVEEGEGELDHPRDITHERFEQDAALFFKDEPTFAYEAGKESRLNTEEEEDEEDDEGDLPGLLADSDEDGDEDARDLRGAVRGAARRAQRRAAWGPEWNDAVPAEAADEGDVAVEADDDGEDVEGGEEVDDAALAAQLADEDLAVEDDMEGALEAIGMRGPLYAVAQNAALMIFVLDTAVGLGVWVPFTFGKSTALLSLDPRRALQVLHWPIRVIRIVTDPVVDSIFFVISYLILPSIVRLFDGFFTATVWGLSAVVPRDALEKSVRFVHTTRENVMNFPWDTTNGFIASLTSKLAAESRPNTTPSLVTRVLGSMHPILVRVEPYFGALGKQARASSYQVATGWTRMALGDGTGERVFAIALGYAVIGLLIAFYLNVFTVGSVKSAGRAVRSAVRQQLLVVKVATFIIIELVLFPLGCGINLDLCSIWLFPEASLQSRIAFFQYAPLTATFYHWVVGTMFMYQFAILLAGCRTIMRPGAMWFIKDPSDQNFHPIRDILERPALVQLRKLSVSAVMYGLVVACGVGSVGGLMRLGRGLVLPLRWKPREPLSDVPIDLLFLHILLPYTLRFFRPRRVIRKAAIMVWKHLCARLRLTSYMFGGRHAEEEREVPCTDWLHFGKSDGKATDSELRFHGSYRRVPNSDNVAVPRDMRATARVNVDGIPVDDEARMLIAAQDAEAEKSKRNPKDDYTVVYIPPHFQYRIGLFIFALWVIGCVFITAAVSVPILLGRGVFNLFTERQMHDGYSFLVGFYALWGCWVVGHAVERMDKRRQRRSADDARGNWPLYFLKRSVLWLAKISYIVFFVGVVIPALLGLVVELYIIMPIRLSLNPALLPNVRVVDMWALGIIYAKIVLHANRFRPLNRISAGFNHIKAHGWTNPEPFSATAEVIAPLIVGLVGMLALPPSIVVLLHRVAPLQLDQRFILMHVYPGIFAGAGLVRLGVTGSKALARWSQSIRDTEFLVEMRLRNYEQEKESEKKEEKGKERSDTEDAISTEEAVAPVAD